jgi:hypothetical protein
MAMIDVGIHPDPAGITSRRFGAGAAQGLAFSTLDITAGERLGSHGEAKAMIFIATRGVLDALQSALDEIRADMDARKEGAA